MSPETTPLSTAVPDEEKAKFWTSAANGTILYVLAYFLVMAVHQLAKMGLSMTYHLRGTWDVSRIVYTMADNEWSRTSIIAVNGIGPLVCAIMGYIAYKWYWSLQRAKRGLFKLLLVWIVLHCCNAFFGALLADTFTQSGFWYVPSWLFQLGNILNVMLAFLAGLAQLAVGYFGAIPFLQAHDSKTVMRYKNRQKMVVFTLILPWLGGSLLIWLSKVPDFSLHEAMHLVVMGLLVTPMALGCLNELYGSTVRRPQPTHLALGLGILALAVALIWRLVLSPPLVFGLV
jgi:hypothetical protein